MCKSLQITREAIGFSVFHIYYIDFPYRVHQVYPEWTTPPRRRSLHSAASCFGGDAGHATIDGMFVSLDNEQNPPNISVLAKMVMVPDQTYQTWLQPAMPCLNDEGPVTSDAMLMLSDFMEAS